MELKELHEEVFKFLLEKRKADPSLRYTLRGLRRKNTTEKLNSGNWFLEGSTAKTLYVSFWEAYPDEEKFAYPIIRFEINTDKICVLRIRNPNSEHKDLWNNIALSLNLKSKIENEWEKEYKGDHFKKDLEHFISTERPYLNSFFKLRGVEASYPPIGEVQFLERFNKIQNLRRGIKETEFNEILKNRLTVDTLSLKNINIFKSLTINFNKHVTCFVGGNGSGKTSILRATALGLVGSSNFESKEISLLTIKEAKKQPIYEANGNITASYTIDCQEKSNTVNFSQLDSGRNFKVNGHNGILKKDNFLDALVIGFAQQTKNKKYDSNPEYSPNIKDVSQLILNESENRFDEFLYWLNGLLNPDTQQDRESNRLLIATIFDIVKKVTGDTNIELMENTTDTFVKTTINPLGIPAQLLSQGYQNILTWVGIFMKRLWEYGKSLPAIDSESIDFKDLPAVCLIDEIDTYLHPDWQYSILKGLVDSFPNVQFIITSHSPFVLTSVPSDKITIYQLNTEGGQIEVKEMTENLYGADANRATSRISDDRTPKFAKLFSRLQNDIDNDRLEDAKAVLKYLIETEHVDEDLDLDILRAKRLIRTKEILNPIKSKIIQ
jgi:predicted ATP-binding protein involved in virulence